MSRRQIVDRAPLIVANVGLLVVFFGPNDLLTSFGDADENLDQTPEMRFKLCTHRKKSTTS